MHDQLEILGLLSNKSITKNKTPNPKSILKAIRLWMISHSVFFIFINML